MKQYEILPMDKVDFSATGTKATMQSIAFLLSTMKMTCPLDREFGWEPDVDSPPAVARAINESRIIEAISEQIEGAEIDSIEWVALTIEDAEQGILSPKVRVVIDGEQI